MTPKAFTSVLFASLLATQAPGTPRAAAESRGFAESRASAQGRPTSYELIARALAAGRIDRETASKYRIFAAFRDDALPQEFRGDDSAIREAPNSVREVATLMSTFSAKTQAELEPFFKTPAEPGSWLERRGESAGGPDSPFDEHGTPAPGLQEQPEVAGSGSAIEWQTFPAAGGKVKVWAQKRRPSDVAKAEAIAQEMTATIWPSLVPLLGAPMSDQNFPRNSGGPEIDIFLVRPDFSAASQNMQTLGTANVWQGLAVPADPAKCKEVAHFLLVDSSKPLGSATSKGLLQNVAHEFAHAITGSKPLQGKCHEYEWLTEATATWAEHKAYPRAQSEHGNAQSFLFDVSISLDWKTGDPNGHAYDSYLFPFYLQTMRMENSIPAMWRSAATMAQRPAVNAALAGGGGLEKVFPKFAVRNLNQASVEEYRTRDQLQFKPDIAPAEWNVSIAPGAADYEQPIEQGMKYLSTKYAHFTFDNSVQMVTFENTLVPMGYAGVWVVERILGDWQDPVDLSKTPNTEWCRDIGKQDLSELLIVFTNNEWRDTTRVVDPGANSLPTVRAHPVGCGDWIGTSTVVSTVKSDDPALTIVETVRLNMRFGIDTSLAIPGKPREHWKSIAGDMTWSAQVTGVCTGTGGGKVPIPNVDDDHVAVLEISKGDDKKLHVSGANGPWPGDIPRYRITCPRSNEPPSERPLMAALGFFVTDSEKDALATDNKSFSGDFVSRPTPAITVHHTYSFRCARGCEPK